jgi:alcohol dehydrogenase class IV
MLASCLAGMAITHTGTSIPHGLSYYLTYNKDIPHGKAVGLFLPGYLKVIQKEMPDEVADFLAVLGFDELEQFAFLIKQLLGDYEITKEDIEKMTDEIMATPRKLNAVPFKVTREDVEDMAAYLA